MVTLLVTTLALPLVSNGYNQSKHTAKSQRYRYWYNKLREVGGGRISDSLIAEIAYDSNAAYLVDAL